MDQIVNVNFQNLTEEEKETFLELCKKSQEKEVKKGLWIPKKNEAYYYIKIGNIMKCVCNCDSYDNWSLINNNCFKTKEEAEFELEKRRILYELRKFAAENNTEEIDWYDIEQSKHAICYNYENECVSVNVIWSLRQFNDIYFTSGNICHKAIEEVGEDRIKKYLFNVEE